MTQKQALKILKTGASVFLTGEPGSGKTHTLREYISYLKKTKIDVAITASTGIAATHIGGMTIHSWSGIGTKKNITDYDLDFISYNERLARRILRAKTLIIDEISMLDGATLMSIDRVCRAVRRFDEPFGGLQTILVGDFFQLPPVAKTGEPAVKFAFNSSVWEQAKLFVCYLTGQYRQSDQAFLDVLGSIRRNSVTTEHLDQLNKRCLDIKEDDEKNMTRLYSHNTDVDRVNNEKLKKIPGEARSFRMESSGRRSMIEQIKRGCLSPEILILKKGAVVMFTKNNIKEGFVNGTLGTVAGFNKFNGLPVVVTSDGKKIEVDAMEWTIDDNGRILAKVKQVPLRLAWALTVHKSQGMSLDAAYMDLRGAFVAGQGYVALSRVRSLAGLFLAGYNNHALKVHPEVLERDSEFRGKSDDAAAVFGRLSEAEVEKMHRNFVTVMGGKWSNK